MGLVAVLCKPLVRRDQQSAFLLSCLPKSVVQLALIWRTTNIQYVVAHLAQGSNCHQGDILIDEDFHAGLANASMGVTCSSVSDAA